MSADLDSTELYENDVWRVIESNLPTSRFGVRASNINNVPMLFGKK